MSADQERALESEARTLATTTALSFAQAEAELREAIDFGIGIEDAGRMMRDLARNGVSFSAAIAAARRIPASE